MESKNNKLVMRLTILIGAIIGIISIYLLVNSQATQKPIAGQGQDMIDEAQIGGDFKLLDQDDNIFDSNSLKGKLSLLYFGFTYCPDICPNSLHKLTLVLETMEKYRIPINVVFITIDPARDTTKVLKEYFGHFHSSIIALTGSAEQIKDVTSKFKVYYAVSDPSDNVSNNYMLDHSSFIYLLDKRGKYLKHFYMNSPAEEIIEYVRINKD